MNKKILKLPQAVFFSDRKQGYDFKELVKTLPKNSAIIIREYDLSFNERFKLAKQVIALAKPFKVRILIGKDLNLAKRVGADGVHFSDFDRLPFSIKSKIPKRFIFSFSCHNLKSIFHAQNLKADMIFISPVFKTKSHIEVDEIGLKKLQRYLLKISFKTKSRSYCKNHIYALGGINSNNLASIKKLNLAGFGAISLFLKHDKNHSGNSFRRIWNKIVAAFSNS